MPEIEAEKLLQKIASQPKKKAAARLRDMFDSLEAALLVKTREEVFKEIEPINLGITFATFRITIGRIRKERGISKSSKKKGQLATPATAPVSSPALSQQAAIPAQAKIPPHQPEEPKGIIDIFSIQAEREEEKKRNPPKRQVLRRL